MNAIIIENEISASKLLGNILNEYCPNINVLGVGVSINAGLKLLSTLNPELVFLDIELDDGQSFDLLDMIEKKKFKIIFTTAYDQYALKAFKYDAVDYILKPYTPKAVVVSVNRVRERRDDDKVFEKLNKVLEQGEINRVSLSTSKGIRLCNVDEIKHLEAEASYCKVHLSSGEKILVSKPLCEIEAMLPEKSFFRVHTSYTVNLAYVKNIIHEDGGFIELKDGSTLPLARRRKQLFIDKLN